MELGSSAELTFSEAERNDLVNAWLVPSVQEGHGRVEM